MCQSRQKSATTTITRTSLQGQFEENCYSDRFWKDIARLLFCFTDNLRFLICLTDNVRLLFCFTDNVRLLFCFTGNVRLIFLFIDYVRLLFCFNNTIRLCKFHYLPFVVSKICLHTKKAFSKEAQITRAVSEKA